MRPDERAILQHIHDTPGGFLGMRIQASPARNRCKKAGWIVNLTSRSAIRGDTRSGRWALTDAGKAALAANPS